MAEQILLTDVIILADTTGPAYVAFGVRELQGYIAALTGATPPIVEKLADVSATRGLVIVVGEVATSQLSRLGVITPILSPLDPGPGGFTLQAAIWPDTSKPLIVVAGSDHQGTMHGLIELIKMIRVRPDGATLPASLDRREKPTFALRGMYVHLHWEYAYPYAVRSWDLDDWKRYVDLLAYCHANMITIWSVVGLLPHPLSPDDRAYLERLREVVAYAKEARGMEVWVGECANNVARSDGGVPIDRREYFAVESRKDPGSAAGIREIMDSREDLFGVIDNADGYWIIDGDPGGWPGSPVSEFVDLMVHNREAINRLGAGPDAKVVYWMHWGWSNWGWPEDRPDVPRHVWSATLDDMDERLPEPWWLLANVQHLDMVAERGLLGKTIFFPYGTIEYEPSPPLTQLSHASLKSMVELALPHPALAGAAAQCQTPLAQLPNIFFFLGALWNADYRHRSIAESTRDLAELIFPMAAGQLGHAWTALAATSRDEILGAAETLETALREDALGSAGPLGQCLFPSATYIVEDLVFLLRIRGYAEQFRERLDDDAPLDTICESLLAFVRSVLSWHARHGYRAMGGAKYVYGDYRKPVNEAWLRYVERTRREREHGADFDIRWPVKATLYQDREFHPAAIDQVLVEVMSAEQVRS